MFYQSVVASAIFFSAICWGGGITARDTNKLNRIIRKAGFVLGSALEPLELVVERRMLHKLLNILDNTSHPLHDVLVKQKSIFSWRLRQLSCKKDRFRKAFVPTTIALYNVSHLSREKGITF